MTMTPIQKLMQKEIERDPSAEEFFRTESAKMDAAVAIRSLRDEEGLTQQELARRAGKPQATIARIENGNMNPSFKLMDEIAQAVGRKIKIEFIKENERA